MTLLNRTRTCALLCCLSLGGLAQAKGESFIDKRVGKDTGGIYSAQDAVPITLGLMVAGCALWNGTEDRFGKTCWVAGESALASYGFAKGLQVLTKRESPNDSADPGRWHSSHSSSHGKGGSFPSGHVAFTTAIVTPFVLDYFEDQPWVAALLLLPAYEMVARVKARDHWQTDVLAGAVLGFAIGAYEHHYDSPFVFSLLPGGAFVGFHKSF